MATAALARASGTAKRSQPQTKGRSGSALVDPAHFLLATRDSGYKTTALAVAELIDNALQAGATTIAVDVTASHDAAFPIELRVTDNGAGMDAPTLAGALTFGGSSRFDDRSSLGRYGMGLPNGGLSRARRIEVFSWRGTDVLSTRLDVDELVAERRRSLPPVAEVPRPSFVPSTSSGTVVRLLRCDRLEYRRPATLAQKLADELGRIYRSYLLRGIDVRVNGTAIPVVDPLFLEVTSAAVAARPFGDVLRYQLPAGHGHGSIEVRFSELPIERLHVLPADEKRRLGITNAPSVSVLRADREIDRGWYFMGSKRRENYDDWWRCEVRFEPELDELFGITHSKQAITPTRELLDALTPDLEPIARALNSRVRHRFELVKVATPLTEAEQQAARADSALPALPRRSDKLSQEVAKLLEVSSPDTSGSRPPYHLVVSELSTTAAFESVVRRGQLVVILNTRHPLYRDLYGPLAVSEVQKDQDVARRVALAILAAARAEWLGPGRSGRGEARRFRQAWADVLATFFNA